MAAEQNEVVLDRLELGDGVTKRDRLEGAVAIGCHHPELPGEDHFGGRNAVAAGQPAVEHRGHSPAVQDARGRVEIEFHLVDGFKQMNQN